jgi:hypothetical protein
MNPWALMYPEKADEYRKYDTIDESPFAARYSHATELNVYK